MDTKKYIPGGRKFVLAMTVILTNALLIWLDVIDKGAYVTVVTLISGGYLTANVTQHIKGTNSQS